jgi:hypothetical protein
LDESTPGEIVIGDGSGEYLFCGGHKRSMPSLTEEHVKCRGSVMGTNQKGGTELAAILKANQYIDM